MKKTKKRFIALFTLIALVSVTAIGVTYAYLSSTTAAITNTFTVGDVQINLTEPAFVPADEHILVPGATLAKNPTVTVLANSEDSYVAIKVTVPKALDSLVTLDWNTTDWQLVEKITDTDNSNNYAYYYKYKNEVAKAATNTQLNAAFGSVYVKTSVTNSQLQALTADDLKVTVQAFAIQSLGFSNVDDALSQWIPAED